MQETGFQDTPAFTECKFTCASGKCLSLGSLVCNQQDDCGDNSDEGGCQLVTERPPPRTFNPELASAQATAIAAVVTVMVVVVVCLLSHYRVSTRSFLSRPSPGRTQEHGLPPEGCLWPSGSSVVQPGASEVMCAPRARDRFIQSERLCRFQPTYPYEGHVDLPPTISLSDGEEPPPYQGPRALQLRDPGQQRELSRESVRAPPNRTVFDSDLVEVSVHGRGPGPPSSKAGISATATATACSGPGAEGPPPTYSEVVGPGPPCLPAPRGSTPRGAPGRTGVPAKGKDRNPGPLA